MGSNARDFNSGLNRIRQRLICPPQDLDITSLENCPTLPMKMNSFLNADRNCSNLSRLHLNEDPCGSESVVSFDSISTKSEVILKNQQGETSAMQADPDCEKSHALSVGDPACASMRRGSCPSLIEGHNSFVDNELTPQPPRRGVSMSNIDLQEKCINTSEPTKLTVAERRERLKISLSRLSQSVASVAESVVSANKPEKQAEPEISDILSPVSSISLVERNTPSPSPPSASLRVVKPPPGPSSGHINDLGNKPPTTPAQFVPSTAGKQLMTIYGNDKPQEPMWTMFVNKSKNPSEFADSAAKMPSVVFCLRGLIRFGNGDYGAARTDGLPHLINILLKRHTISETSASLEAAECSAAVLSMLVINPVSRQMNTLQHRVRFESVMTTQNGFLFQQMIGFLAISLPKYIQIERAKDANLPLMTRATCSVLDIVFVYSTHPALRNSWLQNAPATFRQTVALTITGLGDVIPSVQNRCMCILDALFDFMDADTQTCKQIAQTLKAVVSHAPTPQIANDTIQVMRRWGQPTLQVGGTARKRNSSIGRFLRSLGGKRPETQTVSIKSTIFTEYNHS